MQTGYVFQILRIENSCSFNLKFRVFLKLRKFMENRIIMYVRVGKRENSPISEDEVTIHNSRSLNDQVSELGGFEPLLRLLDISDPNLQIVR